MADLCDLRSDLYPTRPEIGKYEKDTARETNAAEGKAEACQNIDVEAHADTDGGQDDEAEGIAYA